MKVVSILKPNNIKVIGAMAMVRNSIGENAYVSDEIVTSRAGKVNLYKSWSELNLIS